MTEDELRPLLTDEFLSTLIKAVQVTDPSDAIEAHNLLLGIFHVAGKPLPDY